MVAWVLNFDAEDELAAPRGSHTSSRAVKERWAALTLRLEGLVRESDVVVHEGASVALGEHHDGDAWCPTPHALERLRRAGARVPAAPPFEVLRRVNARAFCAALGQTLDGATYATRVEDVMGVVAGGRESGGEWLLKRPLSFAGRGRRKVRAREITPDARAWIEASIRDHGGLQVEPFVAREADFAIHGHVDKAGALRLGRLTKQRCDENGAWLATEIASDAALSPSDHDALLEEASRAAYALQDAGYFGPFGVDAYRYVDARGALRMNPRSEINARYSMGWAIGMAT